MHPRLSPPPVEPSEFYDVDSITIPHTDSNLNWVNTPVPAPTPVFQTPSPVTDQNPFNNQLAETLRQLSKNLNRESVPKPH